MSQRRTVPLGKKPAAAADADTFVKTGDPAPATAPDPEIAKTFRISASLSRRLKIYAAHSGQKEKDILAAALTEHLEDAGAQRKTTGLTEASFQELKAQAAISGSQGPRRQCTLEAFIDPAASEDTPS